MSENKDYAGVDLLIIITRLYAAHGESGDEFIHDWTPPPASEYAGVLKENTGFWMLSTNKDRGLLVVHGYKHLLGNHQGAFQDKILELIQQSNSNIESFKTLAIFAHGSIPETDAKLGNEQPSRPLCIECLTSKFKLVLLNNYSTQGTEAVALALPKTILSAGIGDTLRIMVRERLKLEPVVDVAVRSMQHILLEMRLWCDLWFSKQKELEEKIRKQSATTQTEMVKQMRDLSAKVEECIQRLKDNEHGGNYAVGQVLSTETSLKEFLCETESVTNLREFLDDGSGLSDINWTELEGFFFRCSARLEELIATARIEDLKRAE